MVKDAVDQRAEGRRASDDFNKKDAVWVCDISKPGKASRLPAAPLQFRLRQNQKDKIINGGIAKDYSINQFS